MKKKHQTVQKVLYQLSAAVAEGAQFSTGQAQPDDSLRVPVDGTPSACPSEPHSTSLHVADLQKVNHQSDSHRKKIRSTSILCLSCVLSELVF